MRTFRRMLLAALIAAGSITVSTTAADAFVCHDYPGGCCDSTLSRKLGIRC